MILTSSRSEGWSFKIFPITKGLLQIHFFGLGLLLNSYDLASSVKASVLLIILAKDI